LVLALLSVLANSTDAMLLYPVVVNVLLLALFSFTLVRPPSAIERIARLRTAEFPPSAVAYTRKATIAWAVFFALNATASLYTVLGASLETWALYNGLVSYLLIGCMFLGELAVRTWLQRRRTR
jgi:uncharacterized membrane protein